MTTPAAPLAQALTVNCGADFEMTVALVDASNNPITVSSPRMDVRQGNLWATALILSPTVTASGNTVTVTIAGTATKTQRSAVGAYDLFVTRSDTGQEVKLAYGPVTLVPAVTQL